MIASIFESMWIVPQQLITSNFCSHARGSIRSPAQHLVFSSIDYSEVAALELIRPHTVSNPMAKANKIGRAVIPEPSFAFFSSGDRCHAISGDHHDGISFPAHVEAIIELPTVSPECRGSRWLAH
jgi:hypothetical protein